MPVEIYYGSFGGGGTGGSSFSAGVSTYGNTAGTTGTNAAGIVLVGGTNVTLSQSSAAGGATVSIIGAAGGAFTGGVSSGGNTLGTTGTVSNGILFVGGTNITLSQSSAAGGATVSILGQSGTQPPIGTAVKGVAAVGSTGTITRYSPEDHVHVGVAGINASGTASTFVGSVMISVGNNLTMSTGGASGAGTIKLFNLLSSSVQAQPVSNVSAAGTNASRFALADHAHVGLAGVNASGTASTFVGNLMLSGTNLTLVTGGNSSAGSIGFSVANPVPFSGGVSTFGNTLGTTGTVSNQLILVGGSNMTLSQSSAAGGATVTFNGPVGGGAGMGSTSNTFGTSGTVAAELYFYGGGNVSLSQSVNGASGSLSILGQPLASKFYLDAARRDDRQPASEYCGIDPDGRNSICTQFQSCRCAIS